MFQPHVDLEKTSGGGTSTEETPVSSHVNSVSRSQDSEVTTFEFITAEEPFRGYSFEVSFFLLYLTPMAFVGLPPSPAPSFISLRGLFVSKVTIFVVAELTYYRYLSFSGLNCVGIAMLRLYK